MGHTHTQMWPNEQIMIRSVSFRCQDWCFTAVFVPESAALWYTLGHALHLNTEGVKRGLPCTPSPQPCHTHTGVRSLPTHTKQVTTHIKANTLIPAGKRGSEGLIMKWRKNAYEMKINKHYLLNIYTSCSSSVVNGS